MEINNQNLNALHINSLNKAKQSRFFKYQTTYDSVSFSGADQYQSVSPINSFFEKFQELKQRLLKHFSDNNTYYDSVYSGFEEHFFTLKDNLINKITLSDNQKNILKEKIDNFEIYKKSLSKEEQNELEKNKHSLLDFSLKDGYPDANFSEYQVFKDKYSRFKTGNFSDITNEDLAQLLYYVDTTDIISDGKIGSFAQGRVGSCWFLSMLSNYASTPEGEANLQNRISGPNENGNYTVKLNNPYNQAEENEYIITKDELKNYDLSDENSSFSSGDLDVRIYEIAIEKMLRKYLIEEGIPSTPELCKEVNKLKNSNTEENNILSIIAEGVPEKKVLVHKALGYKDNVKIYYKKSEKNEEPLLNYTTKEFLDSTNANIYSLEFNLFKQNGKLKFIPTVKATNYKSFGDILFLPELASSDLICATGHEQYSDDPKENRYISTGHAFNIMKTDKENNTVVLNDPYNSTFPHAISKDKFEEKFNDITYLPR